MGLIQGPSSFQGITTIKDLARFVTNFIQTLLGQVNGKLDFGANIRAAGPYTIGFPVANTDVIQPHNLGIVPQGFIVTKPENSGMVLISSPSIAWTTTKIAVQSNVPGTITFYVI